ncbi:MAG: PolC-type DNA polymerase III [Bacillota bacterium]|nr:PolC-type DNA polymerase III [Bacillota bacterium]MDW7676058.1 PolC-type DNA polymerase III [Bacillota bacterium]
MNSMKEYPLTELIRRMELNDYGHEAFSHCHLRKIVYNIKSGSITIHLETDHPVPLKAVDHLLGAFQTSLSIEEKVQYQLKSTRDCLTADHLEEAAYFSENIHHTLSHSCSAAFSHAEQIRWSVHKNTILLMIQDPMLCKKAAERRVQDTVSDMIRDVYGCLVKCIISDDEAAPFDASDYQQNKDELETALITEAMINGNGEQHKKMKRKSERRKNGVKGSAVSGKIWAGKQIKTPAQPIGSLSEEDGQVTISGEIFSLDVRVLKNDRKLYLLDLTDYTGSVTAKLFEPQKSAVELDEILTPGIRVLVRGTMQFDHYHKENTLMISDLMPQAVSTSVDDSPVKRIEFHCHTNMSQMDGICSPEQIIRQAAEWGHKAIAITDHGVVQAFPEAAEAGREHGIRIIYGMEGYLVDDESKIVHGDETTTFDDPFVVFDIETTGLSSTHDQITEIGAVRIEGGEVVAEFSSLVNPQTLISTDITRLTGITNDMVANAPLIQKVLPQFLDFCQGAVLVAHNADFDTGFIRENMRRLEIAFQFDVIDTLILSRILLKELKRHRLNLVAKALGVSLENHHRAVHDARATADIFLKLVQRMREAGIHDFREMNRELGRDMDVTRLKTYHFVLIAQDEEGLRHLYELVSASHIEHFFKKPRIPKSLLRQKRSGLLLGSACQAGELFQALLNRDPEEKLEAIAAFYDYLEVQPVSNNSFLIEKGLVKNEMELKELNRKIVELGRRVNRPVLATGDTHYTRRTDELYRQVLQTGMGYEDAEDSAGLYLKTTEEMLQEFDYLGPDTAMEIVVQQPAALADQIRPLLPVPDGTFPPHMEGSEEQLEKLCRTKATAIYGDPLPDKVSKRLDRELRSIIDNGYAVMYMIAHKLVAKSLSDGYLVGSRGSVGSSFAATMSDITEVNPLPPHYICPSCQHSAFFTEGEVESGVDLPDADCPRCGTKYRKEGHQIPFEVFLGFEGDKEPDIDLNFAGEYQSTAHQYIETLFGRSKVFRAGTIGTIANKTAYGYVRKYGEEKGIPQNNAEIKRLTAGCTGVKRTSGQHPGGVMIVPSDRDIHEFTPIQYPANDKKSGVVTTHFDYHALSGRLLKLDILGHDVPTMIRMLEDFTGINALEIPLDDTVTKSIFVNATALNLQDDRFQPDKGTIAIPEFGTRFVRQMLQDTKPSTFGELVRISGLSHGTDVWVNNAQELVRNGTAALKDVICTRDDIMNYLILKGIPAKDAFKIMEKVRKGRGITADEADLMAKNQVPQWYIDSCNKIKYMFPKAHAVAYVMMSFRIAWFKVYYPVAFYAAYFSMKVEDFDAQLMIRGIDQVLERIKELENNAADQTAKEKNLLVVLEVALEMFSRGIRILPVDLYASHQEQFKVEENQIRPPLSSLQGVGQNAARKIAEERQKSPFLSLEDLRQRTGASKVVIETLQQHGACSDLPETNQLSLFNLDLNG